MRMTVFLLITLFASFESFAQPRPGGAPRGPNYNPPGRGTVRPGPVVRPTPVRPLPPQRGGVVVHPSRPIGPRYWNPNSRRSYRPVFRPVIPRYTGTGLTCSYGSLYNGGYPVHTFYNAYECSTAVSDVLRTGDFCDGPDMYDFYTQIREASFYSYEECRQYLGYYY